MGNSSLGDEGVRAEGAGVESLEAGHDVDDVVRNLVRKHFGQEKVSVYSVIGLLEVYEGKVNSFTEFRASLINSIELFKLLALFH